MCILINAYKKTPTSISTDKRNCVLFLIQAQISIVNFLYRLFAPSACNKQLVSNTINLFDMNS